MPTPRLSTRLALLLLCAASWLGLARAAEPAPQPAVTPAQAGQVLEILRDDARRKELEQTLSVIAQASGESVPAVPEPEPVPAPAKPVALEKDGVVALAFGQMGRWLDSIQSELRLTAATLLQVRFAGAWWQRYLGTPEARAETLWAIGTIALILALALAAEALVARLLKRPRVLLIEQADRRHAERGVQAAPPEAGAPQAAPGRDYHLRIARRVPYALAYAVVTLVPLLGFLATTTVLGALFGGPGAGFFPFLLPFIGAYVGTRLTLAALRLLTTPASPGLRLSRLSEESARYLDVWLRRIVVVAAFGVAATEIAFLLGADADARNALSKLVGLAAHAMLIVMVIQRRHAVSHWMRGSEDSGLRQILADIWAPVAIAVIAALWVVWALGAASGFASLLRYVWATALVMLVASVASLVLLGALDRAFSHEAPGPEAARSGRSSYHTLAQRAVLALVMVATIIALLQVWGLHALEWFAAGTVGRRLASAIATIAIACMLALGAWEAANLSINRRMERWSKGGEIARATRLRTLVPILRTTMFIVIALVVLFTALNELGINIAPLLAGASIIGVALGFGSQKLVQDFITGIFLLMEDAMQVGDSVTLAGVSGTVEYLSIRTVRLRAGDGSLHVVPFSSVSTVSNSNRGIGNAAVRVSVRADSDLDQVIATIREIGAEMRKDPQLGPLILADLDLWGVDQVDGATITLAGQIRTLDRGRWAVQRSFNQRLYRRFRERGIRMANPQASFVTRVDAPTAERELPPAAPPPAGAERA
ncbi:mechanosensitive ion channel family protein [Pigmentiphaga humi]|uniref:mechanosensitive ion channel family protein n=1 Tax=Pigmentiphaga humi TaxID=2478468 RepID=UPI000F52FBFD|nr:mechanosensitive ion channel family protein [Pigmentiphaga humi]